MALGTALALPVAALCDEGMWTFQNFPSAAVQQKYDVRITPEWLTRVRLATLRLADCTASFVSPDGLILTNHHCAESCLAQHSTGGEDLLRRGFMAADRARELRCGTQVADVLMEMEDVTAKVLAALNGLSDEAANEQRKKTLTQLEGSCEEASRSATTGPLKCEAVDLYEGGQYFLYKYKRYSDVRLVFTPEEDIAAFGGDPDNFEFPRWCLDMAVLRAYEHDKPAATPDYLRIDFAGPKAGELVFVAGNPGSTERLLTMPQLITQRDLLPALLLRNSELRGRYEQYGMLNAQDRARVQEPLDMLENGIKVRRKLLDALHDDAQLARKMSAEQELQRRIAGSTQLARTTGEPWTQIEHAEQTARSISLSYTLIESGAAFDSRLFRYARLLVRAAAERTKPDSERLREYTDASLPRLEQLVEAAVPLHADLEEITLSLGLARMREFLGPDYPLVRTVLGRESPEELAARLVRASKLADPAVRMALWRGGSAAIAASHDAMIELARRVDPEARAIRHRYEREVEAPVSAASARIAHARFVLLGTSTYPDANFTLRISFGTVRGWNASGEQVQPFTKLARLYERATGSEPFRIPENWLAARSRLDMATPFNFCTDNDIVGGNSGSPVVNAAGHIVGLMFDGNIDSIAGQYWFDEQNNRAVAVHPAIMLEALRNVYHAQGLLAELGAPQTATR
ncbi:MAG TPA: S46 family peptidase [Steroidobacteraceae bacterium]|nr:S46 family peptidase [Steroidobacteraceae bacterium]